MRGRKTRQRLNYKIKHVKILAAALSVVHMLSWTSYTAHVNCLPLQLLFNATINKNVYTCSNMYANNFQNMHIMSCTVER